MLAIYTATLNPKNSMPIIIPLPLFPFNLKSNAQMLIPSTNQISFARTVDIAYIPVPPPQSK